VGWGREGSISESAAHGQVITDKRRKQEMLVAKILMGFAVLNLVVLLAALAMNVALVYFG
jgi:hypothetical protein